MLPSASVTKSLGSYPNRLRLSSSVLAICDFIAWFLNIADASVVASSTTASGIPGTAPAG